MAKLIRKCAWCGKILGAETIEGEEDKISHGICQEDYDQEIKKLEDKTM